MMCLAVLLTPGQKYQIGRALKHGYYEIAISGHQFEVTDCNVTFKEHQPTTGKGEPSFDF